VAYRGFSVVSLQFSREIVTFPVKKLLPADRSLTNGYSPIKTFSGDISSSFFFLKKNGIFIFIKFNTEI